MRLAERIEAWAAENPLRRWRLRQSLSQLNLSSLIGVSTKSIGLWENGAATPSDDHFDALATATGRTPSGLRYAWAAWIKQRPSAATE